MQNSSTRHIIISYWFTITVRYSTLYSTGIYHSTTYMHLHHSHSLALLHMSQHLPIILNRSRLSMQQPIDHKFQTTNFQTFKLQAIKTK